MKVLARAAIGSLGALGLLLVIVVVVLATIGATGIRASERFGNSAASDELTTSTATGQLAWEMDMAYATGEEAFLAPGAVRRSQLLGSLYTSLLPAVDAQLGYLQRLHAGDPRDEYAALERFVGQWTAVRNLLSPVNVPQHSAPALAAQLTAAYRPVGTGLGRLLTREQLNGHTDQVAADANAGRSIGLVLGAAAAGIVLGALLLMSGVRRIRRSMKPSQAQAEFANILQIANDEEEAHQLLRRHLERTLTATTAVVLNRNNSADRLEAVTPLPNGSPLAETLRGAEPRSCLAVRSGQTHRASQQRPALLACPVCAVCPGASACVPLTVGGEVIGSVLLNRAARFKEAEEQRIHESVRQSAPVLANLRNLAVAEIRAATDGLTGLPNKRAVTDALNRMFAVASTTGSPLTLLLLDLDHFKQINDQRGHAVGDQVLANVGAVLRSVLRVRDFAGRNGGEEFAILLPDTEVSSATEIAERVRQAIAEISVPGTDVSVTTSIGVGGFPQHVSTLERLERLTDAALYLAKRHGRNRVELAESAALEAVADLTAPALHGFGPVPVPSLPGDSLLLATEWVYPAGCRTRAPVSPDTPGIPWPAAGNGIALGQVTKLPGATAASMTGQPSSATANRHAGTTAGPRLVATVTTPGRAAVTVSCSHGAKRTNWHERYSPLLLAAGSNRGDHEMDSTSQRSWRTSSYTGASGGNCTEVGQVGSLIAVRDTKNRTGPVLQSRRTLPCRRPGIRDGAERSSAGLELPPAHPSHPQRLPPGSRGRERVMTGSYPGTPPAGLLFADGCVHSEAECGSFP